MSKTKSKQKIRISAIVLAVFMIGIFAGVTISPMLTIAGAPEGVEAREIHREGFFGRRWYVASADDEYNTTTIWSEDPWFHFTPHRIVGTWDVIPAATSTGSALTTMTAVEGTNVAIGITSHNDVTRPDPWAPWNWVGVPAFFRVILYKDLGAWGVQHITQTETPHAIDYRTTVNHERLWWVAPPAPSVTDYKIMEWERPVVGGAPLAWISSGSTHYVTLTSIASPVTHPLPTIGSIGVTVHDASMRGMPNIPIEIRHDTGTTHTRTTGSDGIARFTDIPFGTYTVRETSAHYEQVWVQPERVTITSTSNAGAFTLLIRPVGVEPTRGSITVTHNADITASLYINGRFERTIPVGHRAVVDLPLGRYDLRVTASGFEDATTTITLTEGNRWQTFSANMVKPWVPPWEPRPDPTPDPTRPQDPVTGAFKITSVPSGANVYINGEPRGETPLALALAPGTYTIKVELVKAGGIFSTYVEETVNVPAVGGSFDVKFDAWWLPLFTPLEWAGGLPGWVLLVIVILVLWIIMEPKREPRSGIHTRSRYPEDMERGY